jgi:hypothetical protein
MNNLNIDDYKIGDFVELIDIYDYQYVEIGVITAKTGLENEERLEITILVSNNNFMYQWRICSTILVNLNSEYMMINKKEYNENQIKQLKLQYKMCLIKGS